MQSNQSTMCKPRVSSEGFYNFMTLCHFLAIVLYFLHPTSANTFFTPPYRIHLHSPSTRSPKSILTAGSSALAIQFTVLPRSSHSTDSIEIDDTYVANELVGTSVGSTFPLSVFLRSDKNKKVMVAQNLNVTIGNRYDLVFEVPVAALPVEQVNQHDDDDGDGGDRKEVEVEAKKFTIEFSTRRQWFGIRRRKLLDVRGIWIQPARFHGGPENENLVAGKKVKKGDTVRFLMDVGNDPSKIMHACLATKTTHAACMAHKNFIYCVASILRRVEFWIEANGFGSKDNKKEAIENNDGSSLDLEITEYVFGLKPERATKSIKKILKQWNKAAKKLQMDHLLFDDEFLAKDKITVLQLAQNLLSCDREKIDGILRLFKRQQLSPFESLVFSISKDIQSGPHHVCYHSGLQNRLRKRDAAASTFGILLVVKILLIVPKILILSYLATRRGSSYPYWHYQNTTHYSARSLFKSSSATLHFPYNNNQ